MRWFFIVILTVIFSTAACAGNRTKILGSTYLARSEADRDVLHFTSCRNGVRRLKIEVRDSAVELEKIRVRYRNGQSETLDVRQRINRGGQSRWIDLNGGERCIQSIVVIGDSEGSSRQALVRVLAR